MKIPFQQTIISAIPLPEARKLSRERILEWTGITLIVILAAVLRFANLDAIGYANHYYTAAVESMLQSWHNFFFVAAEPGGSVSVDKPPLGLWIQAISAYFLGVSGFSVVLPQILAGLFSVIVLYHLVKRSFGTIAGLIAALALAITPVVIATDRNNTMDSTLIFTLLLAAWAFIKATETRKLKFLWLGAVLVGLGFNIKMLQAFLPLPAFYALYFFGTSEKFWLKIRNLAIATVLLAVVSFSWAIAVDLTPASQRPYVGSSGNNSEMSLIFGYNGINRLLGMMGAGGPSDGANNRGGTAQGQAPNGVNPPSALNETGNGVQPTRPQLNGNGSPQNNPPQAGSNDGNSRGAPGGGGGGFNIGQAGALRLFIPPLSKETSWLLPFGIISMLALAIGTRWYWTVEPKHQALILWGGWLITAGIFFSAAGFFHEYYLSMMAAPLAALVGIGVAALWKLREKKYWLAVGLMLAATGGTLAFQYWTAQSFTNNLWWFSIVVVLFGLGSTALFAVTTGFNHNRFTTLGFTSVVIAMLITPGVWSTLTNINTSSNQSLPAAYSGQSSGPANRGNTQVNEPLLNFLETNTQGMKYLMAVPSSMQGADYVLATGRPVLYLGGFNGQDSVVSADDLAELVNDNELRYIYWGGGGGGPNAGNSDVSSWVISSCSAVQGFDTTTRNAGAPDGTSVGANDQINQQNNGFGPGNNMQVSLYDCGL